MDTKTPRRGRRTAFRPEFIERARKLALMGVTNGQLGDFFGVDERTIRRWKKRHPEFGQSLIEGKAEAEARGADGLYQCAIGSSHETFKIFGAAGSGKHQALVHGERFAPDVTACTLWLKNRRPDPSRDKMWNEHTGPDGGPIQTEDVTEPPDLMELARRIAFVLHQADPANQDGGASGYPTTVSSTSTSTSTGTA